jgi:hypothetical protein
MITKPPPLRQAERDVFISRHPLLTILSTVTLLLLSAMVIEHMSGPRVKATESTMAEELEASHKDVWHYTDPDDDINLIYHNCVIWVRSNKENWFPDCMREYNYRMVSCENVDRFSGRCRWVHIRQDHTKWTELTLQASTPPTEKVAKTSPATL